MDTGAVDINAKDKYGRTPLHLAVKFGRHARVQELLRRGADVTSGDKSLMTPLHYAARAGQIPIIDLLLDASAQIDVSSVRLNVSSLMNILFRK